MTVLKACSNIKSTSYQKVYSPRQTTTQRVQVDVRFAAELFKRNYLMPKTKLTFEQMFETDGVKQRVSLMPPAVEVSLWSAVQCCWCVVVYNA